MTRSRDGARRARDRLVAYALTLPEAWEDHPWEETVAKVRKRVFVFFGGDAGSEPLMTVKLDAAREEALAIGARPAGYGLGRAGWVSLGCSVAPLGLLEDWIEESYRLIAPKRLAALLDHPGEGPGAPLL